MALEVERKSSRTPNEYKEHFNEQVKQNKPVKKSEFQESPRGPMAEQQAEYDHLLNRFKGDHFICQVIRNHKTNAGTLSDRGKSIVAAVLKARGIPK